MFPPPVVIYEHSGDVIRVFYTKARRHATWLVAGGRFGVVIVVKEFVHVAAGFRINKITVWAPAA